MASSSASESKRSDRSSMADSEGIGERLEKSLEESVAAYKDPWKEAYAPATPNQFASVLPILQ